MIDDRTSSSAVLRRSLVICFTVGVISLLTVTERIGAQQAAPQLSVRRSPTSGLPTMVTGLKGQPITIKLPVGQTKPIPQDFIDQHGEVFGITDASRQLVLERTEVDALGHTHTSYQQVRNGVPVFSGILKIHQNAGGQIIVANGRFYPDVIKVNVTPTIKQSEAVAAARKQIGQGQALVEKSELVIVDPGWYGDPPRGAHLAYYLIITDQTVPFREAFFVDAHNADILDQWSMLHLGLNRAVFDDSQAGTPLVRGEGDPATGDHDADAAYDYDGDTYTYWFNAFGRDSYDGAGGTMDTTVHLVSNRCPNAFGGGGSSQFCTGNTSDDTVAHEWGHSLTENTANFIYQNQPGQLNESYSDIWGEMVDLFNGDAAFVGPPGGTAWPTHPTGPGPDASNDLRTTECSTGFVVEINNPPVIAGLQTARAARFGSRVTDSAVTANVVMANPADACSAIVNPGAINGKIALIDRGTCNFTIKVKNAQDAGAIGVVVTNNTTGLFGMTGDDQSIVIPALMITQDDGNLIKGQLGGTTVNASMRTNAVRWLIFEDTTGWVGAIRDMWNPECFGNPDRANSPLQSCDADDNGGVHDGSGIPDHAFAMMTDGKTFNGFTVTGIGPIKTGAVWYRAQTTYLTVTSDFRDAYDGLNQSAADLIGTFPNDPRTGAPSASEFTAFDAEQVDKALRAVEMDSAGTCGSGLLLTGEPVDCPTSSVVFADDFESGVNGWAVANSNPPTPHDWQLLNGSFLFPSRFSTVWRVSDLTVDMDCDVVDESSLQTLTSPVMTAPNPDFAPTMRFTHFFAAETGWDGGNVKINIDGAGWTLIPGSSFLFNPYNSTLNTAAGGNTNPIEGEEAFTGLGGWGTSVVDLSTLLTSGDSTMQFRFDFGKDACNGEEDWWVQGWAIDDFEVTECLPDGIGACCDVNATCTEDTFDNCVAGGGVFASGACGGDCNGNGIDDGCDLAFGDSPDCNGDGRPDECGIDASCEESKVEGSDATDPFHPYTYGNAVSMFGTTTFVGSQGEDCADGSNCGAVYVYEHNGIDWEFVERLTASDESEDGRFGNAVSVIGDVVLIGAVGTKCGNPIMSSCGSAYMFRHNGTNWVEEQKLTLAGANGSDMFGKAVAISGDLAVVGASRRDTDFPDGGSVFVYSYDGSTWGLLEEHPGQVASARFGESVALSGSTTGHFMAVGAPSQDCVNGSQCGAAYSLRFDGTTFEAQIQLPHSSPMQNDFMGTSVSTEFPWILVGSPGDDCLSNGLNSCGSVIVFEFDGANWVEEYELRPAIEGQSRFGASVGMANGLAVVGAWTASCADGFQCGAAYMFEFDGFTWNEKDKFTSIDAKQEDNFGRSVAVSGNRVAVGAPVSGCPRCVGGFMNGIRCFDDLSCCLHPFCDTVDDGVCVEMGACGAAYFFHYSGSDCDCNSIMDACEPDFLIMCSADFDADRVAFLAPGGSRVGKSFVADKTLLPTTLITNVSGGDNNFVSAETIFANLHPSAGGGEQVGPTFMIETTLADGELFMFTTTPFDQADLGGDNPNSVELMFYDAQADEWILAVDGNTGGAGNRSVDVDPTDLMLSSTLGDYGVVFFTATGRGYVWANLDHATEFTSVLPSCAEAAIATAEPAANVKGRYLSFIPANPGVQTALRVRMTNMPAPFEAFNNQTRWLGATRQMTEESGSSGSAPSPTFTTANFQCTPLCDDWGNKGLIHAFDRAIVPGATYEIEAVICDCGTANETAFSLPLPIDTAVWGDLVGNGPGTSPDGTVDFRDIQEEVAKFKNIAGAPIKARTDLTPDIPDGLIDFIDIQEMVVAFKGGPFPYGGPTACGSLRDSISMSSAGDESLGSGASTAGLHFVKDLPKD